MWYYGVKSHVLGQKAYGALPLAAMAGVVPAGGHGIRAAREMPLSVRNIVLFAGKACCCQARVRELKKQDITVYTPVKREKGQAFPGSAERYFSEPVSKSREDIRRQARSPAATFGTD
jgi:hypothetical protein